jgi:hypothetical protein
MATSRCMWSHSAVFLARSSTTSVLRLAALIPRYAAPPLPRNAAAATIISPANCASATASYVAEQAKIENFEQNDSPARLHKIAMDEGRIVAEPYPGVMVFIDLTGKNFANQYISHVGIVESVNGDEFVSIEGNADNSGLVTRQTRRLGDGFVIAFAEFGAAS